MSAMDEPVLEVSGIRTQLAGRWLHDGVDFSLGRGQIVALIGGSGTGKTVLLRECIGLLRPTAGQVRLLGEDLWRLSTARMNRLRRRYGVLFQEGALFSSLTVAQNVAAPLMEHTPLPRGLRDGVVRLRIRLAGLPLDAADKRPAELSGGMKKRAALARALALEPELLFLDEPTAGLDAASESWFLQYLVDLNRQEGKTILMAYHRLEDLSFLSPTVCRVDRGQVTRMPAAQATLTQSTEQEDNP